MDADCYSTYCECGNSATDDTVTILTMNRIEGTRGSDNIDHIRYPEFGSDDYPPQVDGKWVSYYAIVWDDSLAANDPLYEPPELPIFDEGV